jgi:hypothetical protein
MYGKKQWRGREVEGRYTDMMTFFVRDWNSSEKLNVKEYSEYPHYYFTIEYMKLCSDAKPNVANRIDIIREILDTTNAVVTIEANKDILTNISTDLINRCHIIYRIQDNALQLLKATDTLSIDAGWYRCHMIAKMHMQETTPDSYKFDEEL